MDTTASVNVRDAAGQEGSEATTVATPALDGSILPVTGQLVKFAGQVMTGAEQQLPVTVTLKVQVEESVSYTHLTLPTICSV